MDTGTIWLLIACAVIYVPGWLYWAWTMADVSTDESGDDKTDWMLLMFFAGIPGALIYRYVRRRRRRAVNRLWQK